MRNHLLFRDSLKAVYENKVSIGGCFRSSQIFNAIKLRLLDLKTRSFCPSEPKAARF